MNAVEIEQEVSKLAEQPFDKAEFPFAFLAAFGNKDTALARLRAGNNNLSDVAGGVLLRNQIHLAVCEPGEVAETLTALRESAATTKAKAKFVLATDGETLQAEDLASGEHIVSDYDKFPDHFGFFLPLAGISTIKEIKESAIDVRATGRLNKLYIELLKENPEWAKDERREDMNHFMARLIFCFFAEDTHIFEGTRLFTGAIETLTDRESGNTHEVLSEIFRAMNVKREEREASKVPRWALTFPYVNGGLFSGSVEVPKFSRIARSYLISAGNLEWQHINPDIFGSMIQAVADEEERGLLGQHYTSVPNILKVLNPLFLDDLRAQMEAAEDNKIKLLNLRKRIARIRVFDPACGSGNFLVIAYKELRKIEFEINKRRGEKDIRSVIPLTNFRGIELRSFAAEIARLALIIAEYQCNVLYLGQQDALKDFLPLKKENWIVCGNALRLDWLLICPPTGTGVKLVADDLFQSPLDQAEIDFENEGGETFICGNPPYVGDKKQTKEQKSDLESIFSKSTDRWRSLDYISGFFYKASSLVGKNGGSAAFVSTNSICQGQQVNVLWSLILENNIISSAQTSFKWANLAAHNAGVSVVIVQVSDHGFKGSRRIIEDGVSRSVEYISPYLTGTKTPLVGNQATSICALPAMTNGCAPKDGGNLLLNDKSELPEGDVLAASVVKQYWGAEEIISGKPRYCLWIEEEERGKVEKSDFLAGRVDGVRKARLKSDKAATREWANKPYRFVEIRRPESKYLIALPSVATEKRPYLTPALLHSDDVVITNLAFVIYDPELWVLSLLMSKIHFVWVKTVCGQLETRIRYSNTLGWNTFPVPKLTDEMKDDLIRCAEDILLAREAHFPKTIADLYDPETIPENLRRAHERNDEVIERIYIGRRFKNDTERLERLFALYTDMTKAAKSAPAKKTARAKK